MNKQYSFLSGLPRTGSTLLSSLLSQNPQIHSEGYSHVCELMWQVYINSANLNLDDWAPNILASKRQASIVNIISSIPNLYYADISKPFVLDKSRSWLLPDNINVIKNYFSSSSKFIVLIRPLEEIVASFAKIRLKSGWNEENLYDNLLQDNTHPITIPLEGVLHAKENNQGEYLFIQYDDIVYDTKKTLNRIYDFCEWPKYEHDLNNITRTFVQNDEVYGYKDLHDVRKTIEKQKYHMDIPRNILKKCYYYNSLIFED
jgi:sulfotransferase